MQIKHIVAERRHDTKADPDADGCEQGSRGQGWSDILPIRRESAVGENEYEGGKTDGMCGSQIVELNAESDRAKQHADQQKQQ